MKIKFGLTVGMVCLMAASACVMGNDTNPSQPRSSQSNTLSTIYLKYDVCTQIKAAEAHAVGKKAATEAISIAFSQCKSEETALIRAVERRLMNENGWSSLHPSVRPALLEDLRTKTRVIIEDQFREAGKLR